MRGAHRKREPNVKPVERIELHEGNTTKRLIAVIALIALAVGFFAYAISQLVSRSSGWTQIEPTSTDERNCTSEFVLQYDLGRSGSSATAEYKRISSVYTEAAISAYQTYHPTEVFGGRQNLAYLNRHPNEALSIDPALYAALETLEAAQSRHLFLAPVAAQYEALAACSYDYEAENFDPAKDADVAAFVDEALAFVNDPTQISIELLDGGKARLNVSEAYLRFAEENGIMALLDFGWLKNAFIADDLAASLQQVGFPYGIVSSFDGFARRLGTQEDYSFNVFTLNDGVIYPAAVISCGTADAVVNLRSFALSEDDTERFYVYESGEVRTQYVSAADGASRTAFDSLTAYSSVRGCAQTALELAEVYIADEADPDALLALRDAGIETVFCADATVWHSDANVSIGSLYQDEHVQYTHKTLGKE